MSQKKRKQTRPKAENPKGFRDYLGQDVIARQEMLAQIAKVYTLYGFEPLESPAIENLDALGKFLPDVDRPNEGVFAWKDEDDAWLALRYDLTAPLARIYAQHKNALPSPYRRFAMGPVWRNEKPGPGRYRQFYQCDADTVGSANVAADTEICAMLSETLETVGISANDYLIRINNRKILNGVLEVAGLLDPSDPERHFEKRGIVLRAIDKLDRVGMEGVAQLLGKGRKDPSGDYTKGAELDDTAAEIILRFVASKAETNSKTLDQLSKLVGGSSIGMEGVNELSTMSELLLAQGCDEARAVIDPSVVRGLAYYTGPVIEAELTFEILDEKGQKRQFGSVAGGGRYDDLVKRFTGQAVPATGISIGVDRLLAALDAKEREAKVTSGPVIVTVMDRERMTSYQEMVGELRNIGIRAELYLGNPKNFGNQLKYADARQSPVAVIQGSDEFDKGMVLLKDLALGARLAAEIETAEEWRAQPAQKLIKRQDLVKEVGEMISQVQKMKDR